MEVTELEDSDAAEAWAFEEIVGFGGAGLSELSCRL